MTNKSVKLKAFNLGIKCHFKGQTISDKFSDKDTIIHDATDFELVHHLIVIL